MRASAARSPGAIDGFAWGNLSTIASSITYLYVALQAIAGRLTLGDLTLYTAAAQSVQGSIQGILSGFSACTSTPLPEQPLRAHGDQASDAGLATPVKCLRHAREIRFDDVTFAYPERTNLRSPT